MSSDGRRIDPREPFNHYIGFETVSLSSDGRIAAFATEARGLQPVDDDWWDVFVHDRSTGETEWISRPTVSGVGGDSVGPTLSGDGRYVTFSSNASRLTGAGNVQYHVCVRDRLSGTIQNAGLSSAGVPGNWGSFMGRISRDGSTVVFASRSTNLLPGDTNSSVDLFARDLASGTTELINATTWGGFPGYGAYGPSVSANGRFVAFQSSSGELAPGIPIADLTQQVYLRDRWTGTTVAVSTDVSGSFYVGGVRPYISDDGRYVTFSTGYPILPGDTNDSGDIYVRDMWTGSLRIVTLDSQGQQRTGSFSQQGFSGDGRVVAFMAWSSYAPPASNAPRGLFVRDLAVGRTWRASVRTGGDISVGQAFGASLSRNGGVIAFDWDAPDIVYGTFDGTHGVYVNDPSVTCPVEVYCSAKTDDYDCTPRIFAGSAASLTGWDGSRIVAEEVAAFRDGMLFWGTAPAAKPFQGGVLCVAGPYVRTPVQNSGGFTQPGCTGLLTFHFSQAHMAARGLTAGTDVYAQFWYRGGSAPFESFGLSDAIRFRVCP